MTRFRIVAVTAVAVTAVAVTAVAVIALVAWWVPLEEGGGAACHVGGTCAAEPSAPGGSGDPDWFYGGEGVDRTRGGDDDRPDAWEEPGGEDEIRCGPGRDEAPTGAGEELPRSCEDVRARFY